MQRIRKVILAEQSNLNDATRSMVANLRELCRGLTKAERVRVWDTTQNGKPRDVRSRLMLSMQQPTTAKLSMVSQRRRMRPYRFNDRLMLLPTAAL